MSNLPLSLFLSALFVTFSPLGFGASQLPSTPADRAGRAEGVVRAEVIFQHSTLMGKSVFTRYVLRTLEPLRGEFPAYFSCHAPGGEWGEITVEDSRHLRLTSGTEVVLFLSLKDGMAVPIDGPKGGVPAEELELNHLREACADLPAGADFTGLAEAPSMVSYAVTSNGLQEQGGNNLRFIEGDRDIAIPVIADISTLPNGISQAEALTALENAMQAWQDVSTAQLVFQGTETFSQSADEYSSGDGNVIRVQFHDNFNKISLSSSTLGYGGTSFIPSSGSGGILGSQPFYRNVFGYVVLDHPKSTLENKVSLEEVLTHELGHVLGLAHSSETNPEPDATKRDAIMYYQVHADGRGADLRSWDTETIQKAYPSNTPPFAFDRKIYAVTIPSGWTLTNPQVNQVEIAGWDRNGEAFTVQQTSASSNAGTFQLSGQTLTFTPAGYFSDNDVSDPVSSFFDRWTGTLTDGNNTSPPFQVSIIGLRGDSAPSGTPDGVPDAYMTTYYGSSTGSTASADTDGDGFSTLEEFLMETDPTDAASGLRVTDFTPGTLTWSARRFDVYRIQTRSDLTTGDWTTVRLATQSDAASTVSEDTLPLPIPGQSLFYRVERVD